MSSCLSVKGATPRINQEASRSVSLSVIPSERLTFSIPSATDLAENLHAIQEGGGGSITLDSSSLSLGLTRTKVHPPTYPNAHVQSTLPHP